MQSPENQALKMFLCGYKARDIADELAIAAPTIRTWIQKWEATPKIKISTELRLSQLIHKENKNDKDFNEITSLNKVLESQAKIQNFKITGKPSAINPKLKKPAAIREEKKNSISEQQAAILAEAFFKKLFGYQKLWYQNKNRRIRHILKSRQIGATYYFALEAIVDAARTGDNQIFLSASKNQAHVFKNYIVEFVAQTLDITLKGDPIILANGATLFFLGTNSKTAQSYHGNLYFDEIFWTIKFNELRKVASGMAMHKKWRQTYFSTPSHIDHEAYTFWSGSHYNRGRSEKEKIKIDISHQTLKNGKLCEDGQWRHIVNILDAQGGGCNLFDIESLKKEYSPNEFNNLLMCEFVDGSDAVFNFKALLKCAQVNHAIKYQGQKVWIGYDPSRNQDDAAAIVVLPPDNTSKKYQIIEKLRLKNLPFADQAKRIHNLTKKYKVEHMAIDTSGMGTGVFELVKEFYPQVKPIVYSVEVKNRLVLKASHLINNNLMLFDASWHDLILSFLAIKRSITASGKQITYTANRSCETGHADLAWAFMHAIDKTNFNALEGNQKKVKIISF